MRSKVWNSSTRRGWVSAGYPPYRRFRAQGRTRKDKRRSFASVAAGDVAVRTAVKAAEAYLVHGVRVECVWPEAGMDFNDVLTRPPEPRRRRRAA